MRNLMLCRLENTTSYSSINTYHAGSLRIRRFQLNRLTLVRLLLLAPNCSAARKEGRNSSFSSVPNAIPIFVTLKKHDFERNPLYDGPGLTEVPCSQL